MLQFLFLTDYLIFTFFQNTFIWNQGIYVKKQTFPTCRRYFKYQVYLFKKCAKHLPHKVTEHAGIYYGFFPSFLIKQEQMLNINSKIYFCVRCRSNISHGLMTLRDNVLVILYGPILDIWHLRDKTVKENSKLCYSLWTLLVMYCLHLIVELTVHCLRALLNWMGKESQICFAWRV